MTDSSDSYLKYWGKAKPSENEGGVPQYHLLPYHCLDVAAVGHILLHSNPIYLNHFKLLTGLESEQFIPWFTYLLALHDVGKFSDSFQNLNPNALLKLQSRTSELDYAERHDSLGWYVWKNSLKKHLAQKGVIEIPSSRRAIAAQPIDFWVEAMVGHHGQPPKWLPNHSPHKYFKVEQDFGAVNDFANDLRPLLLGEETVFPANHLESAKLASWWLSGLAVLCDWLGSNADYFPYQSEPVAKGEKALSDYWVYAKNRAKIAVEESGMLGCQPSVSLALQDLIDAPNAMVKPTPLQQQAMEWPLEASPQLFILEDVTGAGKTEAAVLLAHRLMQAGLGNSLYFALPTMATANTMYDRMSKVYRKLFSPQVNPSLVLAHGAREMSAAFKQSVLAEIKSPTASYGDGTTSADAHCNAWLADNRKKALLADIGVGTVDQTLLAILPSRHQSLRLLGLVNKILVVDEVHACDAYMHQLLRALLRAHAAAGGSAILLSATLAHQQRQELLNAYAEGRKSQAQTIQALGLQDYPLMTCSTGVTPLREQIIETRPSVKRRVAAQFLCEQSQVEATLAATVANGQCACWIRNTVKDAIQAYTELKAKHPDWQIDLFHARFAMGDRIEIEGRIVERFNKTSDAEKRQRQILIATQVVEQSLDLDFDTLITDLAPIDLIIQRAGRLRRHARDEKGNPINGEDLRGEPVLYIHSPSVDATPSTGWYADFFPAAQKVYPHHGQLWLTANLLKNKSGFRMPEDARTLIEGVYGEEAQEKIPDSLLRASNEAEGRSLANEGIGKMNALNIDLGYTDMAVNKWWDDSITPTRLGDNTTTVYLACWQQDRLTPWSNCAEYPWQLSAVSIRSYWINIEANQVEIPQHLLDICKTQLPSKGKWSVLTPLCEGEHGDWVGAAVNEAGELTKISYSKQTGLIMRR